MGHSHYPQIIVENEIMNCERKASHEKTPCASNLHWPELRLFQYAFQITPDCLVKRDAQAGVPLLIPLDSSYKFLIGFLVEENLHRRNFFSIRSKTSCAGTPTAAPDSISATRRWIA